MNLGSTIKWRSVVWFQRERLALLVGSTALATWLERARGLALPSLAIPFSIVGGALAILLAFRNGAAYDRWWEGRKLWGGVVNVSRTFARQLETWVPDAETRGRLVRTWLAAVHGLRCAVRAESPASDYARLLSPEIAERVGAARSPVTQLGMVLGRELGALAAAGIVDGHAAARLDTSLTELVALQGGIERIQKTPLPTAYRFFTDQFIHFYVLALPFGLVQHLGWASLLVCVGVGFVFTVLPTIGRLIESPFLNTPNGLPLDAITRGIEIDLLQTLGATEVPEEWRAKDNILT